MRLMVKQKKDFHEALLMVTRLGFEPKTHSLEGCCSIQLSYQAIVFCGCTNTTFFVAWVVFGKKIPKYRLILRPWGCKDDAGASAWRVSRVWVWRQAADVTS